MSTQNPVLPFENVFKFFCLHGGQMLLRDRVAHMFHPGSRERFYALTDVSFSLEHGESMAVVGSNGAGMCDRGLWLDHGRVVKHRRVGEVLKAYRDSASTHAGLTAHTG